MKRIKISFASYAEDGQDGSVSVKLFENEELAEKEAKENDQRYDEDIKTHEIEIDVETGKIVSGVKVARSKGKTPLPQPKSEDKSKSHFVFCALPPSEDARECGVKSVVYIGTRFDWEHGGHSTGDHGAEDLRRIRSLFKKYKMEEAQEGVYDSLFAPRTIIARLSQEPDFAYDEKFAEKMKSFDD